MKSFVRIFTVVLITFLFSSLLVAQQSDYEIKSQFEEQYTVIEEGLLKAPTVNRIDSIKIRIDELHVNFEEHQSILNNALYPVTFEEAMTNLRDQAFSAEQKLLIIESQGERLQRLGDEVIRYRSELTILNQTTDSLRKAIAESQASEERLSRLVSDYRQNLAIRDELVINFIDSLMITYSDLSDKRISEISDGVTSGRIAGDQNPLNLIVTMINENIEYAGSNNSALNVEDHLRMYAVQHHFSETWDRIGNRLVNTYGVNNQQEWRAEIDSSIKDWRMLTSKKMWESMDSYLEFSEVNLDAFDNNYSFFVALDNFIKEAQKNSEGKVLSSKSFEDYKRFQAFWSGKVKNEWSNLIQESDVLTVAQISTIDEQLSGWESEVRPIHPLLLLLIVITVLSILGFGFTMFRSRQA